ncbi:hypothetical protein ABPG72_016019 [Tetrahymena utriculariae]
MFAKPKTRDSATEKQKIQSGNSPQRQTFRKTHMANSVRFTDFTQAAGGLDSPNIFPMYQSLTANTNSEKRIDKLEERLSILASQYDQFIPLLGLLDQANNINKADATFKKIQKKQMENDEKIMLFSQQIQTLQKNVDVIKYQYLSGISQVDNSKLPVQQIKREKFQSSNSNQESEQNLSILKKNQNKIESDFNNIIREMKDEINSKLTAHNKSLEDFKQVFKNEQTGIQQAISHISANYQNLINSGTHGSNGQQVIGDNSKFIEEKIEMQMHILREQIEKEFINIWREIGVACVHDQLHLDQRRKERVNSLLVLPDNLDKFERLLKINNIEQGVLIDEMDQFNKENCQRLVNELRNLEDRINIKQERLQLFRNRLDEVEIENTKKEIEMIHEQFNNLKNQVDGTRKISVYELKRIEDKMEQIDNIRVKISNDPNEKKDLQRITQDIKKAISFQEKISKLVEQIDENLKIVSDFQLKIDEKFVNLQQEVYAQ